MDITKLVPRLPGWYFSAALLIVAIWFVSPQQLSVVLYKVLLVALAVVLSYIADRSMFQRVADRLVGDMPRDMLSAARVVARALVFLAVMLGVTLGI
jgi:hypothetical protein